jgi:hypothetical protein
MYIHCLKDLSWLCKFLDTSLLSQKYLFEDLQEDFYKIISLKIYKVSIETATNLVVCHSSEKQMNSFGNYDERWVDNLF